MKSPQNSCNDNDTEEKYCWNCFQKKKIPAEEQLKKKRARRNCSMHSLQTKLLCIGHWCGRFIVIVIVLGVSDPSYNITYEAKWPPKMIPSEKTTVTTFYQHIMKTQFVILICTLEVHPKTECYEMGTPCHRYVELSFNPKLCAKHVQSHFAG